MDAATPTRVDEVVIGAGITGLTTAVLLARRGRRVAVLEADSVGSGPSGRPGGVASVLHGVRLGEVRRRNTTPTTVAYAQSQIAALDWLRGYLGDASVPATEVDAVSFAVGERGAARVADELALARGLGLDVSATAEAGTPWRTRAAIRMPSQLLVDAPALLRALAAELRALGGVVLEHSRVLSVRTGFPVRVRTAATELLATRVVLATGAPILDRGLYFAKLAPLRRVVVESRLPGTDAVPALVTGVDAPLRTVRASGGTLVTGGRTHGTGRTDSPAREAERIARETARWWPEAEHLASWSTPSWETPHLVPFVGWLPRGRGRVFLATGFGDTGLLGGIAAALTLEADLLGGSTGWQRAMHRRLTLPAAIVAGVGENAATLSAYLRGWGDVLGRPIRGIPEEGEAATGMLGLVPTAVSTIEGSTRALCAVCPHLGGIVRWNDLEHSWDCPAHGSRFATDGTPIEGPSRVGLAPL